MDLRDIVTEEFQQEIQDSFAYATGFGVVFIDKEGRHIGEGSNFTNFCRLINGMEEGAKYCELSNCHAIDIALTTKKPGIYLCHAGLINIEIPLIYDGCYVGAVTAGQVLCSEPDYYARDCVSGSVDWLKDEKLEKYYREIKILTPQQIEAVASALASITNYILQKVAYAQAKEKLLLYEKRQAELEKQLKDAELQMLQKQVTPHFIFNVINSVSRLIALKQYGRAEEMLSSFAGMMRYNLRNIKMQVAIGEELDYIKNYLLIQKIRFGNRITYELVCEEKLKSFLIPFFSLQPLVENSIEHGILNKAEGGSVWIRCEEAGDDVQIIIADDGTGMEEAVLKTVRENIFFSEDAGTEHIGILNCYRRLKLFFGERLRFCIHSKEGCGTRIMIQMKKTEKEGN